MDKFELRQNLLEPVAFEQAEYQKYQRDYCCALCGSHLFATFAPNHMYYLVCPDHGKVLEHTITHKGNMDAVQEGRYFAERDLQPPSESKPEDILKQLGF